MARKSSKPTATPIEPLDEQPPVVEPDPVEPDPDEPDPDKEPDETEQTDGQSESEPAKRLARHAPPATAPSDRIEVFDVDCPDGIRRRVTRNIDTGAQTTVPVDE